MGDNIWMNNSNQGLLSQNSILDSFDNTYNNSSFTGDGLLGNDSNNFMNDGFNSLMGYDSPSNFGSNGASTMGSGMFDSAGGVMDGAMTLMNGINMFKSWGVQDDMMDLYKEQLGMAREQWDMTKQEVARIAQVRKNLTSSYMA